MQFKSHKWNNKTCQYECKNYRNCKKDYTGQQFFFEISVA